MESVEVLWTWFWKSGGYNSCMASSWQEALNKARKIAARYPDMQVNVSTLRRMDDEDLRQLDALYQ